jgi:threonyl-tRNA synthetase
MIHRAILGSLERFIAILVEHYGGEFPLWLAPQQVAVLSVSPVSEETAAYAGKVHAKLVEAGLRSEIDLSEDNISAKIKACELQKLPYMAVVGARESAAGTVAIREHKKGNRGVIPLDDFVANLRRDVAAKNAL